MSPRETISNPSGQMLVEAVLIMALFLFMFQVAVNQFQSNAVFQKIVETPWKMVSNMAANGNWKANTTESQLNHPIKLKRHISLRPANGGTPQ